MPLHYQYHGLLLNVYCQIQIKYWADRNASHEKETSVLKAQLSNVNDELIAAKLNIEIVIKELNDAKSTIATNDKFFKERLEDLQNTPSTSTAHQGFTPTDSIQAIQDLVMMQGKSMKWMTESFKKGVNIVSNLEKK